jgi:hypothetical protein
MYKTHGQGRLGAVECASQRAHARRLLLTLADVCRRLRRLQKTPAARAACQQVERSLGQLIRRTDKPAPARIRCAGRRQS